MTHGKKRRRRTAPGRSEATAKPQPAGLGRAAEEFVAKAGEVPAPRRPLDRDQALLEACQQMAAMSLLASNAGPGWDQPDKRSYLESMFRIACSQWQQDQRNDAADTFRDLLKLDRDDHQFARYWLAATLLDLQRHDDLQRLLEQYEEATAAWRYAQALLAFRLGGDSDDARRRLREAQPLDPHFLDYLLGDGLVHADRPVRFGGDPRESTHSLARLFLPAWRSTPGAAAWARKVLQVPLGNPPSDRSFPRDELRGCPAAT